MRKKRSFGWLLVLLCIGCLLGGCKEKGKDKDERRPALSDETVLIIGTEEVSLAETMVYLQSMKEEVEALYGEAIWEYTFTEDGRSYAELMKEELLEKVIYIKLVCYMADEFGIALDADDILNVNEYTEEFFTNITEETAKRYGITEELIRRIYMDNVLAQKVYETMTLGAELSYTEEEIRQARFLTLYVATQYEAMDGTLVSYSEEEIAALRTEAEALLSQAKEAEDVYAFANEHSDREPVEIVTGKDGLPEESAAAAFALQEGEFSKVVEEEDGFYVFYCVSARDEDATRLAEEAKIRELSEAYFDSLYETWSNNISIEVNEALWKTVRVTE